VAAAALRRRRQPRTRPTSPPSAHSRPTGWTTMRCSWRWPMRTAGRDWCDWPEGLAQRNATALAAPAASTLSDRLLAVLPVVLLPPVGRAAAYANARGVKHRRGCTDLHRLPERRGLGPPGTVRAGRHGPPAGGGRRAARLLQRHRPALGQPAVPLGRPPRRGLRLVDRTHPPHLRAGRHRAHRPLPRLCRLLGDPGQRADGHHRPLAARVPAPRCSRPSRPHWARCRSSPKTWASDHARVDALRLRFSLPGMRILQFAFGGGNDNTYLPHNYDPAPWCTPARTTTTPASAGGPTPATRSTAHVRAYLGPTARTSPGT
jgi:hypothetical protein